MTAKGRGRLQSDGGRGVRRVHTDLEGFRSEVFRMRSAQAIASETGLFTLPTVYDVDEAKRSILVEWIESYEPIARPGRSPAEMGELMYRLGGCIAAIHAGVWEQSTGTSQPLFHGDLDPYNVGLDEQGRLVFLDWDPAPGLGDVALTAQEKDLGLIQFSLMTLFVKQMRSTRAMRESLLQLRRGYSEEAAPRLDHSAQTCAARVAEARARLHTVPGGPWPRTVYRWSVRRVAKRLLRGMYPNPSDETSEAKA